MLVRDAKGKKKEAIKVVQTTRKSNTTHPRQSTPHALNITHYMITCICLIVCHYTLQHIYIAHYMRDCLQLHAVVPQYNIVIYMYVHVSHYMHG